MRVRNWAGDKVDAPPRVRITIRNSSAALVAERDIVDPADWYRTAPDQTARAVSAHAEAGEWLATNGAKAGEYTVEVRELRPNGEPGQVWSCQPVRWPG